MAPSNQCNFDGSTKRYRFLCHQILIVVVVFLCQVNLLAAEKTVRGNIKSVDAAKNSIKVDDLELDVTRKTKITVDGKKTTLADIKAGQPASVTYDDKLDVAASIAVGADESPSKTESVAYKKTGCRVVWTIAENGDSTLLISRPLENREKAIDSMIRHDDGTVEFQHSFRSKESVEKAFAGTTDSLVFDKAREALVTTTNHAKFSYSNATKLPISLEFDFDRTRETNSITFVLQIIDVAKGESAVINLISNGAFESAVKLDGISWASPDGKGKVKFEPFTPAETLELKVPKEFKIKMPLVDRETRYSLNFGVHGEAATMTYLSIRGRLSPKMGIKFNEKTGTTVENVFPNGLADTIGIKSGDVLTSVNGKKTASLKEAMDFLGKIQFGDESEIVVKRNGRTVKIGFTAE